MNRLASALQAATSRQSAPSELDKADSVVESGWHVSAWLTTLMQSFGSRLPSLDTKTAPVAPRQTDALRAGSRPSSSVSPPVLNRPLTPTNIQSSSSAQTNAIAPATNIETAIAPAVKPLPAAAVRLKAVPKLIEPAPSAINAQHVNQLKQWFTEGVGHWIVDRDQWRKLSSADGQAIIAPEVMAALSSLDLSIDPDSNETQLCKALSKHVWVALHRLEDEALTRQVAQALPKFCMDAGLFSSIVSPCIAVVLKD